MSDNLTAISNNNIAESIKILIVDDDPGNLQAIIEMLEKANDKYILYQSIRADFALRIAKIELPDIIITDWEMPEMSGIELICNLKKLPETVDIPVIMCTGVMTSSDNLKTALEAGAVDFIRKPVDEVELVARINSIFMLSKSLQYNKKLAASRDKMFAIIAHDLQGPIGNLRSMLDILIRNDYQPEALQKLLKLAHNSVSSTFSLLQNLLTWTKAQKGTIEYMPNLFDIKTLVDTVLALFSSSLNEKSIIAINEIEPNIIVYADKNMISTVIRNLISNSIKFSNVKGQITFKSQMLNNEVEIIIEDNGIGMSDEIVKKLLDSDEYISTPGTNRERGSGLGLKLCIEFLQRNKSGLQIYSKQFVGSKFCFNLPVPNL